MESGIQSSFIPHDTAQPSGVQRAFKGGFLDLAVLISIVLLVASLVLGTGVFLYQQSLETSSKSKAEQIKRQEAAFEPALILKLTRLDDRMRDADQILGNHIAPSAFLHMLEQVTLSTVQFRSMSFDAADQQNISIKMVGVAQSVNSVALQAERFSGNGIIKSPIFSNIDRQQDGVHFSLSAFVNPASIRYVQLAGKQTSGTGAIVPISSPAAVPSPTPAPVLSPSAPAPAPVQSPKPSPAPVQSPKPQVQPPSSRPPTPSGSGGLFGQPKP